MEVKDDIFLSFSSMKTFIYLIKLENMLEWCYCILCFMCRTYIQYSERFLNKKQRNFITRCTKINILYMHKFVIHKWDRVHVVPFVWLVIFCLQTHSALLFLSSKFTIGYFWNHAIARVCVHLDFTYVICHCFTLLKCVCLVHWLKTTSLI